MIHVWRRLGLLGAGVAFLVLGCATYRPTNAPLERFDPDYGYRAKRVQAEKPMGEVLLLLAFSGGGTRAATLSYGVLQELRDTGVRVGGEEKRLLDEVDVITSVSGGSFTSAYYGLFGDRIFEDYEERFLRRNVQGRLMLELFRPKNWFRLASTFFDRSELAIELYDREIFDRATFGDLLESPGPFVQINAADLAVGNRFTFFQPQFDFICSDLSKLEVARAVAASSAVPVLLSPITLRNFAGSCGFERPAWLDEALAERKGSHRRYWNASVAESYLDAGVRKYIHLADGGIADNLGLRGPLDSVVLVGGIRERLETIGAGRPKHIVVLVVNAEVHPDLGFNLRASAPSLGAILSSVTGLQIYRYNFETIELMRESMERWGRELSQDETGEPVGVHLVEVDFQSLEDPEERDYFNELPTSFVLDDTAVDRLIEVGRRLLRESPNFQRLVEALRADPMPAAGAAR
ncbi:patatin-like phospholipase family protein [bacterium]|nr:patatin-like phospholipase family protein [bacterium]